MLVLVTGRSFPPTSPIAGKWDVTAVAQVSKFEDQSVTITVPIHR